jgi:hypothetical protein
MSLSLPCALRKCLLLSGSTGKVINSFLAEYYVCAGIDHFVYDFLSMASSGQGKAASGQGL